MTQTFVNRYLHHWGWCQRIWAAWGGDCLSRGVYYSRPALCFSHIPSCIGPEKQKQEKGVFTRVYKHIYQKNNLGNVKHHGGDVGLHCALSVGGCELYSRLKSLFRTYWGVATGDGVRVHVRTVGPDRACELRGAKQGRGCVTADSERWLTLHTETRVASLSCLPHETGFIKIPRCLFVRACVRAHLTGSNTSLLVCAIDGRVRLHEIYLVFCVFVMLRVSPLSRGKQKPSVARTRDKQP